MSSSRAYYHLKGQLLHLWAVIWNKTGTTTFSLFLFIWATGSVEILDKLHLLIHADDANITPSSRNLLDKIHGMVAYCKKNKIILQLTKCMFFVINGSEADKEGISFDNDIIPITSEFLVLGSWLSKNGSLEHDLNLQFNYRFNILYDFWIV